MDLIKVALIREGKVPHDKRVALTPNQCVRLMKDYPHLRIMVQKSEVRAIPDSDFTTAGIEVRDDISDADIMIGVKEVNTEELISGKTYLFFSHTYKKQPYNRQLLQTILRKKIRLVDYEVLTYPSGGRVIGFGRYAGIVGAYNSFLAYGLKTNRYNLKPAHQCEDRKEVEQELKKVRLNSDFKMVMTGRGRVGSGAREIVDQLNLKEVSPEEFLKGDFNQPVFTHMDVQDYNAHNDGKPFDRKHFFAFPKKYQSTFPRYSHRAQLYIACHYWSAEAPFLFTREDARDHRLALRVIGDISCDIDGPVACTIRPSTIKDPLYGYDPVSESEVNFKDTEAIGVMAVDNLPCELPKDASEDFGEELIEKVFPHLLGDDSDKIIWRGTQTLFSGELAPHFNYLEGYVKGEE